MRAFLLIVAVAVAGCGGTRHPEAVSRDGRAVFTDAIDGRLDRQWSCGSLRAALHLLPPGGGPTYTPIPAMIGRAAGQTCDKALRTLHLGMTAAIVSQTLGRPDTNGRCPVFRWPPADTGTRLMHSAADPRPAVDGVGVCFAHRRVSLVKTAVHG